MGKSNNKKRSHGVAVQGAWLPLPIAFLRSRACASLSLHATKMLVDLTSQLGPNAQNNGNLQATPELMALRGWTSTASRQAAVAELLQVGLLIITRYGSRRLCALYAVTLWPLEYEPLKMTAAGPGSYATRDWSTSFGGAADELSTFALNRKDPSPPPPAVWSVLRRENAKSHPAAGRQSRVMTPPRESKATRIRVIEPVAGSIAAESSNPVTPPRDTFLEVPSVGKKPKGRQWSPELLFPDGRYLARQLAKVDCSACKAAAGSRHTKPACEPCPKCKFAGYLKCKCRGRVPTGEKRTDRSPATSEESHHRG